MKRSYIALFLAFSVLFGTPAAAYAASSGTESRYFVPTTKSFWKGALKARHIFEDGFTADLSDFQIRLARLAGIKPIAVKKFNILADAAATPTPQPTPAETVSWGVRAMIHGDATKDLTVGAGRLVAVLDTGIDREHPDLKRRLDGCNDLTDPASGFIEDSCDDLNGHGTHVAGIIAADGGSDGTGMFGFAPAASVSAYRVCSPSGTCFSDDIAVAIRHAVDAGANIIVLGVGGEAQSSFIDDALGYAAEKHVMVIGAAGNDGPYEDSLDWPARDTRVLSVGALNSDETVAEFSSRGTNRTTKPYHTDAGDIEFAAPGVNIESTFREGGYAILSGTSMAAPHLAGLAVRVWQGDAKNPAEATRALLHELAVDVGTLGDDAATGWGMPVQK
ncbi:MAG: S8 family serine peptidase [Candidatus Yanofskybacteria bacterium]|nr:S8 family serine peptidase [Candidatus Yanofskybacteria bacterium]